MDSCNVLVLDWLLLLIISLGSINEFCSNSVWNLLLYYVWTIHVQHLHPAHHNSIEIKTHTMMLPIMMHEWNTLPLIQIMTSIKVIQICTVAKDTMQIWQCKDNTDDEILHGNATAYVHLGVTYIMEYHECCGRQRWQARQSENGWYNKKGQWHGWYCNIL